MLMDTVRPLVNFENVFTVGETFNKRMLVNHMPKFKKSKWFNTI